MAHLLHDIELPLVEVLADMEHTGVRIDTDALAAYSKALTQRLADIERVCIDLAGIQFNVGSPAQVGEVLFDRLKIDEKAKKTKTGQYSTTEEVLEKLSGKHPIVGKILEFRKIKKLLSTYVNALPELINPHTGKSTPPTIRLSRPPDACRDKPEPAEHPYQKRRRTGNPQSIHPRRRTLVLLCRLFAD